MKNPRFVFRIHDDSASRVTEDQPAYEVESPVPLPRFEIGDVLDPAGWFSYADTGNRHRIYKVEHTIWTDGDTPVFECDVWTRFETGLH